MNGHIGLDLSLPLEFRPAAILISLLSVAVLVGIFSCLTRYTRRRYFSIWMTGWVFYGLWLFLSLVWPPDTGLAPMFRQCCLGVASVFLLWGNAEFLGQRTPQRMMALFLTFVFLWSALGVSHLDEPFVMQAPVFGLLGVANVFTAASFLRFRRRHGHVGAGLLSFGYVLWGTFFIALPWLLRDEYAVSGSFFILAVLQLFIAVSMIVLALEEVRREARQAQLKVEEQKTRTEFLKERARSSEERFRSLFEQASEAIVITTADDLRITELNKTARRLLGIEGEEATRTRLPGFLSVPADVPAPEGGAAWIDFIHRSTKHTLVRRDGSTATIEVDAAPVRFDERDAYQFFLREVTERARLEQQLRQAEKLSALGQMISGVAHELNNPLAAVKGYLDLVLTRHELPERTRTDLEKAASESNRAAKLVGNFLSFAREQPARRMKADLNELLRRAFELREYEFRTAGVTLSVDLQEDLPATWVDPDQVQQAVMNLLSNGLHAVSGGAPPHRMTIRTRQAGGMIRLSVADNGPGVPEHISARVFEPFFTTKEVGAGTGLGLSIVHSVMTDHGGRVFHEATLGGGATFVLEFPVVDGPPAGAASAPEEGASRATSISGARVLILDDEPSITELLGEMLGMLGCQTSLASSAPKALELMQAGHFDVILSDFRMPMMNGQAFYEEVQRRRPELAARIIFISGDVINDETQGFLQSTGNLHLTKPFNLQAVEDAVSSVLRRDLPASGSSGSSG